MAYVVVTGESASGATTICSRRVRRQLNEVRRIVHASCGGLRVAVHSRGELQQATKVSEGKTLRRAKTQDSRTQKTGQHGTERRLASTAG